MKILHTADWHLGVKTEGKSRIEEQRKIMEEICTIATEEKVDVVLVAGDVFDQAVPTAGAEDLFYETMDKLTENSERVEVVIAGNHDDPKRLTAGVHFAKKHNVIIISNLHPDVQKRVGQRITVESFAQGSVCVTVKTSRGEQKCNIAALPYPQEYRLEEKAEAERIAAQEAAKAAEEAAIAAAREEEERRKALEVNLDALDKVLTVSESEQLNFKDPYEERTIRITPVEEEEDEILKALDRYFVMDEEDET